MSKWFHIMRTHINAVFRIRRELLRHNSVKRLMTYDIQPGNASAPQNQLQRYSWGQTEGPKRETIRGG